MNRSNLAILRNRGALLLILLTANLLVLRPLPGCFDCEGENPWGYASPWPVSVDPSVEAIVGGWTLLCPFLAGLIGVRRSWLIPPGVITALLATQPLGGVALWSLRDNEGPVIIILELPIQYGLLFAGHFVRWCAKEIDRRR